MKEGDIILTLLPQAGNVLKRRPALLLRELPPFGDFLVAGVSTQTHQAVPGFDEVISPDDPDFAESGLRAESIVRLGFLAVLPRRRIMGAIGAISRERRVRLIRNLCGHLAANLNQEHAADGE
ncbi:MAG: type II toxin-antitoxin system PemK/MazF family toxin [Candidatus Omnitrophica bacterium]|nr:type II toxin-antitoxin system PemK/MazF family toxin [Candidatus Omnitrophota bacterium]